MALTITTYTGAHFAPTEPAPEGVRIQDVATPFRCCAAETAM